MPTYTHSRANRMHDRHRLNVGATTGWTLHRHGQPSVPSVLTVQVSVVSLPSMPADSTPALVNRP